MLIKLLVRHAVLHVDHDRAAEQQVLELVRVPNGRRVEQVLVPALLLEGHITPMLLEATLVLEAELVARAPDLVVIADEELVHKHRVRMRVGDQGQPLSER